MEGILVSIASSDGLSAVTVAVVTAAAGAVSWMGSLSASLGFDSMLIIIIIIKFICETLNKIAEQKFLSVITLKPIK